MGIKSTIIPEEWKADIDKILRQDLLSANRYFAAVNPSLSALITGQIEKEPRDFVRDLRERWRWHHTFYEETLEPAIPALMPPGGHFALTPQNVEYLKRAYMTASVVDQATLVGSAAIKKHLDLWIPRVQERFSLSEAEVVQLLSSPEESFYVSYERAHLGYLEASAHKDSSAEDLRARLLDKYHAGDQKIFEGRLRGIVARLGADTSPKKIREKINKLESPQNKAIDWLYLSLERPQLRALGETVAYDNCDEYEILYSLKGISGFILRKAVLGFADKTKTLPNTGNIYEHPDHSVVAALDQIKTYRESTMFKEVRHLQQTLDNCAPACLAMAENYWGLPGKSLRENEREIASVARSSLIPGSHFSGIALHAAMQGLEARLFHSEAHFFRPNQELLDRPVFNALMEEYQVLLAQATSQGAINTNSFPVDSTAIKNQLKEGNLVIAAGMTGGILHAVLVTGYNSEGFVVADPLKPKTDVRSAHRLDHYLSTPIGKWMISVRPKQDSLTSLMNATESYTAKAHEYLNI